MRPSQQRIGSNRIWRLIREAQPSPSIYIPEGSARQRESNSDLATTYYPNIWTCTGVGQRARDQRLRAMYESNGRPGPGSLASSWNH